jgi:hypothetical protein
MHFVASAHPYHRSSYFHFRISCKSPKEGLLCRPGLYGIAPMAPRASILLDGTARASQVPGESFPCLCPAHETPAAPFCYAIAAVRCCPRWTDDEGRSDIDDFGADSHGFSICCLRFQASVSLHWQDSLPAGGKPLPGGFRTHWTPMANFKQARQPIYSNAPGLAWRHCPPSSVFRPLTSGPQPFVPLPSEAVFPLPSVLCPPSSAL